MHNREKNLIHKIFNYISCKYKYLKGIKWTCAKDGQPEKVAIVETTFAEILEACEITDMKIAVSHLDKEGYLIRQSRKRLKSKLNIDGVPCYAYQLDVKKANMAFGNDDDDSFTNVGNFRNGDLLTGKKLDVLNDEETIIHEGNYKITGDKRAVSGTAFLL